MLLNYVFQRNYRDENGVWILVWISQPLKLTLTFFFFFFKLKLGLSLLDPNSTEPSNYLNRSLTNPITMIVDEDFM